jgi:hypothetical protein
VIGNEIEGKYRGISFENSTGNLIANNMVYLCINEGLYDYTGAGNLFCYNSVYMQDGTAFGSRLLNRTIIKNNILFQDGPDSTSFAILFANTVADSITSDYNDLYAPYGTVCFFDHTWLRTLADYQTATGLDLHSINADPNYVSVTVPFDLHIADPSPCDEAGIPVPGITTDIDGDPRDPITPDIGADEIAIVGPPGVVDDLIITLSSTTDDSTNITLFWSPTENTQQYHIYKSTTDPGSGFALLGSTADTTYTDFSVIINELKGFYYVTADNQSLDIGTSKIYTPGINSHIGNHTRSR